MCRCAIEPWHILLHLAFGGHVHRVKSSATECRSRNSAAFGDQGPVGSALIWNAAHKQHLGCRQRQHEAPHLVRIFILAKNREWRPASAELGGVARVVAVFGPRQASRQGSWQAWRARLPCSLSPHPISPTAEQPPARKRPNP